MFAGLTGWHIVIIVLVILVLFGATKLPVFAKGLGQSIKIFKSEVQEPEQKEPSKAKADSSSSESGSQGSKTN